MRFVAVDRLKDGMLLAKTVYGTRGEVLLMAGQPLSAYYIDKVKKLGYNGIYIEDDEETKVFPFKEFIDYELHIRTVSLIKKCYEKIWQKNPIKQEIYELKKCVGDLVEEVEKSKEAMVNGIDIRTFNDYLFYHSVNVAILALALGIELDLSKNDLYDLGLSALFHDIGKTLLPKELIGKTTVSEKEKQLMETHPQLGFRFLKEKAITDVRSYIGVLEHHERMDGTGYPNKKRGKDIYIFARIISIADAYDNMTANTFNGSVKKPSEAMEYIMGGGDTWFDVELATLFARKVAPYPVGTYVKLSNGLIGIVIDNSKSFCMRPKIKVLKQDNHKIEPYYLDLRDPSTSSITVESIVD